MLISHYLPVQTHHNNYRTTFSNLFGESKEIQSKLHSIVEIMEMKIMEMILSTASRC